MIVPWEDGFLHEWSREERVRIRKLRRKHDLRCTDAPWRLLLGAGALHPLYRAGYRDWHRIAHATDAELLAVRHFGRTSLRAVRAVVPYIPWTAADQARYETLKGGTR